MFHWYWNFSLFTKYILYNFQSITISVLIYFFIFFNSIKIHFTFDSFPRNELKNILIDFQISNV